MASSTEVFIKASNLDVGLSFFLKDFSAGSSREILAC